MGLKSLLLSNKNFRLMYFNNSFNSEILYNRTLLFWNYTSKFFNNFFNLFFIINHLKYIKSRKINNSYQKRKLSDSIIGKLSFFLFQKWIIINLNFLVVSKLKTASMNNFNSKAIIIIKKYRKLEIEL